jgi:arginine/lysine/ornithine decarboxylase
MKYLLLLASFSAFAQNEENLILDITEIDKEAKIQQQAYEYKREEMRTMLLESINILPLPVSYQESSKKEIEKLYKEVKETNAFDLNLNEMVSIVVREYKDNYTLEELKELQKLLNSKEYKKYLATSQSAEQKLQDWAATYKQKISTYTAEVQNKLKAINQKEMALAKERIEKMNSSNK